MTRHKEGHYIMIQGSINQEDITIENIYTQPTSEYLNILSKYRSEGKNRPYINSRGLQYSTLSDG